MIESLKETERKKATLDIEKFKEAKKVAKKKEESKIPSVI